MPRIARIVLPNTPHHVTQRGNRRQKTFFNQSDYKVYLNLLFKWADYFQVNIDAYCLMPNHVHLILRPSNLTGMTNAMREIHRSYTLTINRRYGWQGCLWQGRFFSVPLDEEHFENAIRYVELNPVRAHIVTDPTKYPWSSAAHRNTSSCFYDKPLNLNVIRKMTTSGRPECSDSFAKEILNKTGVNILRKKVGRPHKLSKN